MTFGLVLALALLLVPSFAFASNARTIAAAVRDELVSTVAPTWAPYADQGRQPRGVPVVEEDPSGECDAANVAAGASNCPLLTWSQISGNPVGYFRVPNGTVPTTGDCEFLDGGYMDGSMSMKIGSTTNLWINDRYCIAELIMPTPILDNDLADLTRATFAQTFKGGMLGDSNDGLFCDDVACEDTQGAYLSAILDYPGDYLYIGGITYYPNGPSSNLSLFRTSKDLPTATYPGAVVGWDGDGTVSNTAAFVGQHATRIPTEWQTALGGPAAFSGSTTYPIAPRTSNGPSFIVVDPTQINTTTVTGQGLMYYLNSNGTDPNPTLGRYSDTIIEGIWSATAQVGGMAIINGSRTLVVLGSNGTGSVAGVCYGVPEVGGCLNIPDPEYPTQSYHAPAYEYRYMLYDLNDLKSVKEGTKTAESMYPYAHGSFTLPWTPQRVRISGVTYEPSNRRLIFMPIRVEPISSENAYPVGVVWQVSGANP